MDCVFGLATEALAHSDRIEGGYRAFQQPVSQLGQVERERENVWGRLAILALAQSERWGL